MKSPTVKQTEMLQKAMMLHESGQLEAAAKLYKKLLTALPNDSTLLTNLGAIALQQGKLKDAVRITDKSLQIAPNQPFALNNCGIALRALNRLDEAVKRYDQAIALCPDNAEAYYNRGNALKDLNRLEAALESYDQAIILAANYLAAYVNRGLVLRKLSRLDDALVSFNHAAILNPNNAEVHYNRGSVLQELNRLEEALASYDRAIVLNLNEAEVYFNRGYVLQVLKRLDDALASYDSAIARKPDHAEAYANRGVSLHDLKRLPEALASYDRAIELNPDNSEAYSNRGLVYQELKRLDDALINYDHSLALNPDNAEAYSNRGTALQELKRMDEALACYDRALALKPGLDFLAGQRLHVKMQICDWLDIEAEINLLSEKIKGGEKVSPPFEVLGLVDNALLQRQAAEIWVREKFPKINPPPKIMRHPRHEKIRVAYFSADFRCHPVAFLTAELFEKHDGSRFEITAFAFGPGRKDEMRTRLEQAFDHFIDVRHLSDREIVHLARKMEIDIAIDLGGHTKDSGVCVFAMRAAPLQVGYIGYLGTMGADYMDYLIADTVIIPERFKQYYAEKIVYLPSYQANDTKRQISEKIFTRAELGLPEKGFVFCCFNNNFKISPETFDGWMRILGRVENSVLYLFAENQYAEQNLKNAAVSRGVDAERLIFGKRMSLPDYLARYRTADLFLDTLPYNAGTTASDALWAGLPVLTCMGEAFPARIAASLLNAIGLPELIATSQEQYEALAIEIATNTEKLAGIKAKLAQNRLTTPLFDIQLFTRHIEDAYQRIYQRYIDDQPPEHIYIQAP